MTAGAENKSFRRADPLEQAGGFVLLVCLTVAAYAPALRGNLLWDDDAHVTKQALRSLHGLWRIWFESGATQQYYPLLHSAFWIEHRFWGDAVLGYHLLNVTLHAAAACLVVLIMRQLRLPGAWLGGFIFALHPVCVEAVAWISEQKSTLSGVFYLSAALIYLRYDADRRESRYWLAFGLFVLALLTKSVTATLPAALLIVFWWQRGRLDWKRDVSPLIPWFVFGACAGLFTARIERIQIGANGPEFALTPLQHVLLAGRVLWFYASKLVWPSNLIFIYPHWTIDPRVAWQYLFPAGAIFVALALLFLARRHRGPLAAFLFFSGTLFPVLGFLNVYPFRFSYVADHFQYLASLGVIVPAAAVISTAVQRVSSARAAQVASIAGLAALLAILTSRQSIMYKDSETLFRTTLARNPNSWMAHNNLGFALLGDPSRAAESVAHLQEALRLNPRSAEAHNNLGLQMAQTRHFPEAIAQFKEAIRIEPGMAVAHYNLATALSATPGDEPEAIREYETALKLDPYNASAHCNLGIVLLNTPGRWADGFGELSAALSLDPNLEPARHLMSRLSSTLR